MKTESCTYLIAIVPFPAIAKLQQLLDPVSLK